MPEEKTFEEIKQEAIASFVASPNWHYIEEMFNNCLDDIEERIYNKNSNRVLEEIGAMIVIYNEERQRIKEFLQECGMMVKKPVEKKINRFR